MFTDQPVTPMRLEILIETMSRINSTVITRKLLMDMLQPKALVGENHDRVQSEKTIAAAFELGLLTEVDGYVRPAFDNSEYKLVRDLVLSVIELKVLGDTSIEPYFAPFYSYLLALNSEGAKKRTREEWAIKFERDVLADQEINNPFNNTKYTGVNRWYSYVGLGWYDPASTFQPNPYYRLRRSISLIFGTGPKRISGDQFMEKLAASCPELDGGKIFLETTRNLPVAERRCTLGLSHALYDLHLDGHITLHCPADTRGWDFSLAEPSFEGTIGSNFIAEVELKNSKNKD